MAVNNIQCIRVQLYQNNCVEAINFQKLNQEATFKLLVVKTERIFLIKQQFQTSFIDHLVFIE